MTGTWINIVAVLAGGGLGLVLGARFSDRLRQTIVAVLGLFTSGLGLRMFLETQQPILALGGLALGAVLGEWWRVEDRLESLGHWLETRSGLHRQEQASENRFVRGFLASSLLFCVGPMTILGSVQDGLRGDYSLLAVKSVLDGFASMALASTLGVGVLFSVLVILIYQGGLTLLAAQVNTILTSGMTAEMTAAGGLMLLGLAISTLLELKRIRVGNLLPGLVVAPLLVAIQAPAGDLLSALIGLLGR